MNIPEGFVLGHSMILLLAYADDYTILGDSMKTTKKLCKKLTEAMGKLGLIINYDKTEYMKLTREIQEFTMESLEVECHNIFFRVPQFKHLEVLLTQVNELKMKI